MIMKIFSKLLCLSVLSYAAVSCCQTSQTNVPVYLDEEQPLELRVEDALSRMTLEEKVKVLKNQATNSGYVV